MQRKLLGIINVDFDATGQLLIIYCAFVRYLKKKREYREAVHQLFIDFKRTYDSIRREILYNILIEFDIPLKLVRLVRVFLKHIAEAGLARICLTCFLLGMV